MNSAVHALLNVVNYHLVNGITHVYICNAEQECIVKLFFY